MAITYYKKPLKTAVFTLHDASTVTAADTVENPIGSNAIDQYKHHSIIIVPGENNETMFDFDQVVKVVVTTAQSEDIPKDYCPTSTR
ncbi:MAG: hypothetical protein U0L88_00340 [Acutalibacteraceae bacterium]|nr:hypothetical protein [Acutalibacteraceae bacterium]